MYHNPPRRNHLQKMHAPKKPIADAYAGRPIPPESVQMFKTPASASRFPQVHRFGLRRTAVPLQLPQGGDLLSGSPFAGNLMPGRTPPNDAKFVVLTAQLIRQFATADAGSHDPVQAQWLPVVFQTTGDCGSTRDAIAL